MTLAMVRHLNLVTTPTKLKDDMGDYTAKHHFKNKTMMSESGLSYNTELILNRKQQIDLDN